MKVIKSRLAAWAAVLSFMMTAWAQDTAAPPAVPNSQSGATVGTDTDAGGTGAQSATGASNPTTSPLRIGKEVKAPKVLSSPDPDYPEVARRAGYGGTVVLWLIVDTDGSPKDVKVQRSLGMGLDRAAYEAVRRWRFQPATKNGQPVPVMINVEVNFRPEVVGMDLPLFPGAEAKASPPQFPGVDLSKYPLVLQIDRAGGVPAGKTYEIVADATVISAGQKQPLVISCSGNRSRCSFLNTGYYSARWLKPNEELEILGKQNANGGWRKAEYTVKSRTATSHSTP